MHVQRTKPLLFLTGIFSFGGPPGLEPRTENSGLYSFHCSVDFVLIKMIARIRWVPSSLSTFLSTFMLRLSVGIGDGSFDWELTVWLDEEVQ